MTAIPTIPRLASNDLAPAVLLACPLADELLLAEPVVVAVTLIDLDTVTGTLEPLTVGRTVKVVHALPLPGHTSARSKSLSSGPVGPESYFHSMLRFIKLTCRGSLSGYCSSPQRPRNESQGTGVESSEPVSVPFVEDEGL
jgi:hypothetical protein